MFFFLSSSRYEPKVKSGEHYTAEWWQKKAGFDTKHKCAARLAMLVRKGIVEKVSADAHEIVRFMPTAMFCENDIVTMLKEMRCAKCFVD